MNRKREEKQDLFEIYKKFDEFEVPEFQKTFRGYAPNEADRYLNALIDAYNKMYEEYLSLEAELNEYRRKKEAIAEAMIELKIAEKIETTKTENYYGEALENNRHNNSEIDIELLLKQFSSNQGGR